MIFRDPCGRECFDSSLQATIAGRKVLDQWGPPVRLVNVEVTFCGNCQAWHHAAEPPPSYRKRLEGSELKLP